MTYEVSENVHLMLILDSSVLLYSDPMLAVHTPYILQGSGDGLPHFSLVLSPFSICLLAVKPRS